MKDLRVGCVLPLFGLVFAAMGCLFSFVFGRSVVLDCTRLETPFIQCTKQTLIWGVLPSQMETVDGLQRVWVEESCDEGCTYRVVLETERRTVPLTNFFTSEKQAKYEVADQINDFLDSSKLTLHVEDGSGLVGVLLPLIFIGVGFFFFVGSLLSLVFGAGKSVVRIS